MKRIIFSFIAMIALAFGAMAQTQSNVEQIVAKVNALCPYEYAEGLILQSVTIDNGAIVHTFAVDPKKVDYSFLKDNQDILHDAKVAEILTGNGADSIAIRNVCINNGTQIIYRYTSGNSSFDIVIIPADLK